MNLSDLWKDHKVAILSLGGATIVLFIILSRSGSSNASANNPVSQVLGYNEQQNELNAQVALQQQQIGAQQDAVDQQAQAQEDQVNQAASAQNNQTTASLIANLYDTQQGANVDEAQLGDETSVENTENNDQLSALQTEYNSSDYQADLTAQLYSQGLTDSTQLGSDQITAQEQAEQDQYSENEQVLGDVGAAGLNHGTSSLENSLAGIIAEIEGEQGPAESYANANAAGAVSSNNASASEFNSILSGIAGLGKSTISGLIG